MNRAAAISTSLLQVVQASCQLSHIPYGHHRSIVKCAGAILKSIQQKQQKEKTDGELQEDVPQASTSKLSSAPSKAADEAAAAAVPWNASKLSTGHLAASLTSTSAPIQTKTERALYDEEMLMFEAIVGFEASRIL